MHLDVDLAVQHADLDWLVDKFSRATDANDVEKLLDILGIEADTAVRYEPANRPGVVGIVNRVQRQGQVYTVLAHRVVRRASGDHVLAPALFLDAFFFDRLGNDPDWIGGFPTDFKLRSWGRPVFASQADGQGNDEAIANPFLQWWEVVEPHLRDVDHHALVSALRDDPEGRYHQGLPGWRDPGINTGMSADYFIVAKVEVTGDIEQGVFRLHHVFTWRADDRLHSRIMWVSWQDERVGDQSFLREKGGLIPCPGMNRKGKHQPSD